jgi:hypothetical protein
MVILLCVGVGLTSRPVVVLDYLAGFHFGFEFHDDSPYVGAGLTSRRVVIRDQFAGPHPRLEFHSDSPLCWSRANEPAYCD